MSLNNDPKFFSALDAKKLSEEARDIYGPYLQKETLDILELVKAAAHEGKTSIKITTQTHIDPIIVNRLNVFGYSVFTDNDTRERQCFNTIDWED